MKSEFKKQSVISIIYFIPSTLTIIFALLALTDINNFIYRVLSQAGLCLAMLFQGVKCYFYDKHKAQGIISWLASGFLVYVIIDTICVGIQKKI